MNLDQLRKLKERLLALKRNPGADPETIRRVKHCVIHCVNQSQQKLDRSVARAAVYVQMLGAIRGDGNNPEVTEQLEAVVADLLEAERYLTYAGVFNGFLVGGNALVTK